MALEKPGIVRWERVVRPRSPGYRRSVHGRSTAATRQRQVPFCCSAQQAKRTAELRSKRPSTASSYRFLSFWCHRDTHPGPSSALKNCPRKGHCCLVIRAKKGDRRNCQHLVIARMDRTFYSPCDVCSSWQFWQFSSRLKTVLSQDIGCLDPCPQRN